MVDRESYEASYYRLRYAADAGLDIRNYDCFLELLNLKPGKRVLDVGSGLGMLAAAMSSYGAEVVGVDVSPFAVKEAQKRYPEARFVLLNGNHLDREFQSGSFDAITCVQVLEHIPLGEVDSFISQMAKCLRDGGHLLVSVPITDNLSDRWLIFRNQYLRRDYRPPTAIDSSFDPMHLWRIGDLNLLIDRFRVYGLGVERVCKLYYVPWILDRLNWGRLISFLPVCCLEQFLKGATVLFRKGAVGKMTQTVQFSAFWSDPPGASGLARLKKLLA
jgi:2-polyprenyl-3-methyl-5-hydroxy-6-metoxy-1,4-benzoquinol methylase